MPATQGKKSKKKSGQHKKDCEKYRIVQTRETNKARNLTRHIKRHKNDGCAVGALKRLRKAHPLATKKPINKLEEWLRTHGREL